MLNASKQRLTSMKREGNTVLVVSLTMFEDPVAQLLDGHATHEGRMVAPTTVGEVVNEAVTTIEVAPACYLDDVRVEWEQPWAVRAPLRGQCGTDTHLPPYVKQVAR